MSVRYGTLKKKPRVFRQLTTLSLEEFDILVEKLEPEWIEREYKRKSERIDRTNAVGQGHPYFADFPTLVLLLVMYTRTNCNNMLLCLLFGISEQTLYDLSPKLLPLLQDRFLPGTFLRKKKSRINTLDELLKEYPGLSEVIADGTDITTRRPKRRQRKNYSGKSKRHSKKTVLLINPIDGLIVEKTRLRPGSVHDKRVLGEDPLYKKLDSDSNLSKRADSAWTGEDKEKGWIVNKRGRRNHPLTETEKKTNRKLSKVRIKVEHAIRRMKVFRRIGEKTAFRMKGKLDTVVNAAINLSNFKQLLRFPSGA
ncbi:MAG: transposase family protein [Thermodesulfobacteriota bacterium]